MLALCTELFDDNRLLSDSLLRKEATAQKQDEGQDMQNKDQLIRLAKSFGLIAFVLIGSRLFGAVPCLIGYLVGRFVYTRMHVRNPVGVLPMVVGVAVCAVVTVLAWFGLSMALYGVLREKW